MIIKGCRDIPVNTLGEYVSKGIVTIDELMAAGLQPEKQAYLNTILLNADHLAWNNAVDQNTPDAYQEYVRRYPAGQHVSEAFAQIAALEEYYWDRANSTMDQAALREYLRMYPGGLYAAEANEILNDSEWLNACRINTIAGYEHYRQTHPGKHTDAINDRLYYLQDEKDWNDAVAFGTTDALYRYINAHPDGMYVNEAYMRIQANAGREAFLAELSDDPNAYPADKIKENVGNGMATWSDIAAIFGPDRAAAIERFNRPSDLPTSTPSPTLQPKSTEVYFWGTPASGKTCALGSIISSSRRHGIYEGVACSGYDYMTRLSNIFDSQGFCTFPDSTSIGNIQEMILKLRDKKGKRHKVTLIDLAGELFRSVYFKLSGRMVTYEAEQTLQTALNYLHDKHNEKIHFFVVEYGAHDREWEGLKMVDYLEKMVSFLREQRIMRTTTVGVYVLVTKCDLMPCPPQDRPRMAYEYVQSLMGAFWNTLQDACRLGGVKDLKVLSFSIGDVFAQNLCQFDGRDSDKVIDKLLTKTPGEGGAFGDFFAFLRS